MQVSGITFNTESKYIVNNKNNISINPTFQGLTNTLKFQTYIDGQKDIKEILASRQGKSVIVGSLPKFIINKLPKMNRKEAIMDIYKTFDVITEQLRSFKEENNASLNEIMYKRPDSAVKIYRDLLLKYHLADQWTTIDIRYLGKGGKGAGYHLMGLSDSNMMKVRSQLDEQKQRKQKIKELNQNLKQKRQALKIITDPKEQKILDDEISKIKEDIVNLKNSKNEANKSFKNVSMSDIYDDEFVIKVFHVKEGENWHNFKSHGCYAELNSAQYWMNTVGNDTQRGKFFWGSMGSGYMINKFVDDDVAKPKRNINPYMYGLKCTDEDITKKHNVCKGYSFDWGGVRVVNRFKNADRIARSVDGKIRDTDAKYRTFEWEKMFYDDSVQNIESKNAGLALSIKHLENKTRYIDKCLELKQTKVNQALAYVLKYLPYETALEYFEKLVQTKDPITQVILFNEIPLLAMKHRDGNIKDELGAMRSEIILTRVDSYYQLAEKYALPESIEHLASFVHLLPKNLITSNYRRLAEINNTALHERLIYKLPNLPSEFEFFAMTTLAKNLKDEELKNSLANSGIAIDDIQKAIILKILEDPENFEKYRLY